MSARSEGCYRKEVFIMFANVTNTFNSAAVMGAPTKSSRAYKRGNSCHAYMGGVMGNSQHIKAGKCYHWNATTKWTMPAQAYTIKGILKKAWQRHMNAFKEGREDASWMEERGLLWA